MRRLWIIGLIMIGVAFIGSSVSSAFAPAPISGASTGWWGAMNGHHEWMHGYREAAAAPIPGAQQVTIRALDLRFDPPSVTVTGPVNLTLANQDSVLHDLTIPALGIKIIAGPGEQRTTGIQVDPGTYEFLCSVPGHAEAGMTGTIEVTR